MCKRAIRVRLIGVLGMALSACAAPPQKPVVAAADSPAQPSSVPNSETSELDRLARQKGYRVVIRNSQRLYCQYSASVGSHIARMQCLNAVLMAQMVRDDRELQDKFSQRGNQLCPSCVQRNN